MWLRHLGLLILSSLLTSASVDKFDVFFSNARANSLEYNSPFKNGKVQLHNFKLHSSQASGNLKPQSSPVLPAGTELVVLVDTECAGTAFFTDLNGEALLKTEARPLVLTQDRTLESLAAEWNVNPCVMGVSENLKFKKTSTDFLDPKRPEQYHLEKINWEQALGFFKDSSFKISSEVSVAIVDTGIESTHEDLSSRMWRGPSGEKGANFVISGALPEDDNGHGTHCAGLVGAVPGNGVGVSGVMFDHVKLMPVKVLDSIGDGSLSSVASGIRYAADNNADVISLSLGAAMSSAILEDALQYAVAKGSFVVIASGNDGQLITDVNFYSPVGYAPAIEGALSVGSIDALSGRKSTFSNYSPDYVELAAPGSAGAHQVLSTWMGNSYKGEQGTSMSAPLVAGAAALTISFLKQQNISYTPQLVEMILKSSAKTNSAHKNAFTGGRELDMLLLRKFLEASYLFEGRGGFEE